MTIAYRDAELDDAPFIVSAWSRAFKPSNSSGMIVSEDWEPVMHRQIQKVLSRPDARTIVAFERDDPAFLYGFIAGDAAERVPVVFFTYVKESYRRSGIARGLFAALGVDPAKRFFYICWVPLLRELMGYRDGVRVAPSKIPYAKHDPHIVRYPKPESRSDAWKR